MRKLGYKSEDKDHISALIIGFLFSGVLVYGAFFWWNDAFLTIIGIAILVLITMIIVSILCYKKYVIEMKRINNIKNNGIKVDGIIQGYKEKNEHHIARGSEDSYTTTIYKLFVMYNDPNTLKPSIIETPELNFTPYLKLGSTKCSVYIFNGEFYVTDFVSRKNGEKIELKRVDDMVIE